MFKQLIRRRRPRRSHAPAQYPNLSPRVPGLNPIR